MKTPKKFLLAFLLSAGTLTGFSQTAKECPPEPVPQLAAEHRGDEQYTGKIGLLNEDASGLELGLLMSTHTFRLSKSHPDYNRIHDVLKDAQQKNATVIVTVKGGFIADVKVQQ